ncbi:MAG: hypothetical protein H6705_14025 [Myxococcales bacterium]|nr:hypothetical protein [Myxococcales bacterium]
MIDWTARVARVVGVGTPRILSPTGAVTGEDLHDKAREDAAARMTRLLRAVPVGGGETAGQVAALDAAREAATRAMRAGEVIDFSDGTVHQPAEVTLDWVAAAWPAGEATVPGDAATGIVITLSGEAQPTARVELRGSAGAKGTAGARGDRLAPAGLVWARAIDDAPAGFVGERPRAVAGEAAGEGIIALGEDAADLFTGPGIGGGLVVLVPVAAADPVKKDPKGKSTKTGRKGGGKK